MPTNGHDHEELPPSSWDMRTTGVNNNNQPIYEIDQLFYVVSLGYAWIFPRFFRRLIEFVFLFVAVLSFFVLVYSHMNFLQMPANCLDHVKDVWPRDGILRVEIIQSYQRSHAEQSGTINELFTVEKSYEREYKLKPLYTSDENAPLFNQYTKTNNLENKGEIDIEPFTEELVENKFQETSQNSQKPSLFNYLPFSNYINFEDEKKEIFSTKANRHTTSKSNFSLEEDSAQFCSTKYPLNSSIRGVLGINSSSLFQSTSTESPPIDENDVIFYESYIVEYSLDWRFLFMSPNTRNQLGIPVMLVTLEPTQNKCFGDSISQFFLKFYYGYDGLLMSSVKSLVEKNEQNKGFIRYVITEKYYRFMNIEMSRTSYIASFFVMVIFTALISVLSRYTHYHIFALLEDLWQLFIYRRSFTFQTAPFLAIMALVGIRSMMLTFFNDINTTLFVILIVWIADRYISVVCHPITKRHLRKFFYLYQFSFYAYHNRFDGQNSNFALICSSLFTLHSLIYFYHHYDLPYVLQRAQMQQAMFQRLQHQH